LRTFPSPSGKESRNEGGRCVAADPAELAAEMELGGVARLFEK
jgi:hypothetical protein